MMMVMMIVKPEKKTVMMMKMKKPVPNLLPPRNPQMAELNQMIMKLLLKVYPSKLMKMISVTISKKNAVK
jgi:hypothetical protein